VVTAMQPLSEIRNGRATVCCHLPMCGLTVKLTGRPKAHNQATPARIVFGAGGADIQAVHGHVQRLLADIHRSQRCAQHDGEKENEHHQSEY
jgi:hypothetical protein